MKKNISPIKKLSFFLLAGFLLLLSFPKAASAADSLWFHQDFGEWFIKTLDPSNPTEIFGERYTAAQVQWVLYSLPAHFLTSLTMGRPEPWICAFSGDISNCIAGATEVLKEVIERVYNFFSFPTRLTGSNTKNTETEKNNAFSFFYSFLQNNPVSGIGYLTRKFSNIYIAPNVHAQGFGYTHGGAAVQKLWQSTRDLSYSLLIIAVIIMAFMIMFKVKISPQTVITVQSALPKIITAIILITFSYAIAGLLIDLMYVVIGIFSFLLERSGVVYYSATELFKDLTSDRNVFVLSWHFTLMFLVGTITTILSGGFFGGILLIFIFLVVLIATIFNSFRILWLMIKTYVNTILLIVTAPLQILLGLVVSGGGIGSWIKSFVANLAIYPTVGVMFVFAFFFVVQASAIGSTPGGSQEWYQFLARIAPFQINTGFLGTTTAWDPPLTWGTNSGRFLWMLVGFAIYMLIPKAADIIKAMIEGKPFAYGTAIGETTQPARIAAGAGFAERYAYYTSTPPGPTSGRIHKIIGGLYEKASPQARNMLDQTAKTIQSTITGK